MSTQRPTPSPMTEAQIQAAHLAEVKPLNGTITLVAYDPTWPQLFAREATRIRAALGDRARLLEHVGSTSVPGLAAKPKIDLLLVVVNTADESAYVPALEAAGYVLHIDAAAENIGESPNEIQVPLTTAGAGQPIAGNGFITSFQYGL